MDNGRGEKRTAIIYVLILFCTGRISVTTTRSKNARGKIIYYNTTKMCIFLCKKILLKYINFEGSGRKREGNKNGRRKTERTADKKTEARRVTTDVIIDNVRHTERDAGDMCNSAGS